MPAQSTALPAKRAAPADAPDAAIVVKLKDGRYLHMLALPLGPMAGTVVGAAQFDASGTRALVRATFAGAAVDGDWHTLSPTRAFLVDAVRRQVHLLSAETSVAALTWAGEQRAELRSKAGRQEITVGSAAAGSLPSSRIAPQRDLLAGGVRVSPDGLEQISVHRVGRGRYVLYEAGTRYRIAGIARSGAYAVAGSCLTWIDNSAGSGRRLTTDATDDLGPVRFSGSSYGDALTPIVPLGHAVYQGAYRNGTAYFPLSYRLSRIVAATQDFQHWTFPRLPSDPTYSTGDSFGTAGGGRLYFAWPEGGRLAFAAHGGYRQMRLHVPEGARDLRPLVQAMSAIAPGERLWPPLRPDEDALDAALLQWRLYPLSAELGKSWIASYLGRMFLADSDARLHAAAAPSFPFALLGKTDDGRIWGAAPRLRTFARGSVSNQSANVWWTRDGVAWHWLTSLQGSPGAVATSSDALWIALTQAVRGEPLIAVMRRRGAHSAEAFTGGSYNGEQLFFASVRSGFYLVWGATPGWRLNGDGGVLSALRIDPATFFDTGANELMRARSDPALDASLPAAAYEVQDGGAFLEPSLRQIAGLHTPKRVVLRSNAAGAQSSAQVMPRSIEQERAYEIKYGARPHPLATVAVSVHGEHATVLRELALAILSERGTVEDWTKTAQGWQLRRVVQQWHN